MKPRDPLFGVAYILATVSRLPELTGLPQATVRQLIRRGADTTAAPPGSPSPLRLVGAEQAPIDRYRNRKVISTELADAADRLLADWQIAGISTLAMGKYERTSPGADDMAMSCVLARQRVTGCIQHVGIALSGLIIWTVCDPMGEPIDWLRQRYPNAGRHSAMDMLRMGLHSTHDFYERHAGPITRIVRDAMDAA